MTTSQKTLQSKLADLSSKLADPLVRKQLITEHFFLFWWYYFGHHHKRDIPSYKIDPAAEARHRRLLDVEPRGHGKSVMWSCGWPLWIGLTNPFQLPTKQLPGGGFRYCDGAEERIAQVSNTGGLAAGWIKRHKYELTYNRKLIQDWGQQSTLHMKDGKWAEDEIMLLNGASLYSKSSYEQVRGFHPLHLAVDDLENRKEAQKRENRQKMREYFFLDLYGVLGPEATMVMVGTYVHPEGLLPYLFDREIKPPRGMEDSPAFAHPWKKFKFSAINPDGSILAPEIWSYEALMLRKAELPHTYWMAEYMNRPQASENPIFPSAWFQKEFCGYDSKAPAFIANILPQLQKFSFVDPASKKKESNDYTAIITVGLDKKPDRPLIYILEVKRFRELFRKQLQNALDTWLTWRGWIGFEAIQYQSMLGSTFDEICRERGWSPEVFLVHYREEKYKGQKITPQKYDKESRAHKITHLFNMGQMRFDHMDPLQEILMQDLQVFPDGEHDDTVDALVGCLWEVDRVLTVEKRSYEPQAQIVYDPETGVPTIDAGPSQYRRPGDR